MKHGVNDACISFNLYIISESPPPQYLKSLINQLEDVRYWGDESTRFRGVKVSDHRSFAPTLRTALGKQIYKSIILDQVVCAYGKIASGD